MTRANRGDGSSQADLERRVDALELQLRRFKWAASVAGGVVLALFGVQHWWEVPRVARDTFDKWVTQQVGAELSSRLRELNTEFKDLAGSQEVATARVLEAARQQFVSFEAARQQFVSFDTPYLIASDYLKDRRWNLDVKDAKSAEGQPADISSNGEQRWKVVR